MRGTLGLAPHLLDDARAVDGRVAVHGADDELELRLEALGLLRAGAHQREETHALAVEAEVLGEGLREQQLTRSLALALSSSPNTREEQRVTWVDPSPQL